MRTASLTLALLMAAALAGCLGGTSNLGDLPDDLRDSGTVTGSQSSNSTAPSHDNGRRGNDGKAFEPYLEVSPDNGTAPLNVTLTFGVTWTDNGRRGNDDGNGTSGGNGTDDGNRTRGSSGNQSSSGPGSNRTGDGNETDDGNGTSSNRTGNANDGRHESNGGHDDFNWSLEVRYNGTAASGNATGNSTGPGGDGNATGNSTGNSTSSSSSTTGSSSGNGTGNQTGSGNQTGNQTGNGTSGAGNSTNAPADGTVLFAFNGTGDELPSNRSVTLNATGSYDAVFTVTFDNGSTAVVQRAITVGEVPPGTPLGNETRTFEGSFLASAFVPCLGSEDFEWALNGTFNGTDADISHVNVTVESAGFADIELTLTAPNGTEVQSGAELNATGPFEPGNYTLTAESCFSADAEFTVTAVAHYVTKGSFA